MARDCRLDVRSCHFSPHNYKHFPFDGMTREDTKHGPARYLDAGTVAEMEDATARNPHRWRGMVPAVTEYARDTGRVIGWDQGRDATLSYVECVGSATARTFHGRPMHDENPKTRGSWSS